MNNRELKFRVWDIFDKCFCYLDYDLSFYTGDSESRIFDGIPRYVGRLYSCSGFYKKGTNTRPIYNSPAERIRYVIQQYTGFKDKNGKMIFEGDIFKSGEYKWGPVEFESGQWQVNLQGARVYSLYELINDVTYRDYPEVIGNIFENPELLKK